MCLGALKWLLYELKLLYGPSYTPLDPPQGIFVFWVCHFGLLAIFGHDFYLYRCIIELMFKRLPGILQLLLRYKPLKRCTATRIMRYDGPKTVSSTGRLYKPDEVSYRVSSV